MTYDWEHDPDIISKPEFIGFKKIDEVNNGVDKKKNGLKMHIHKNSELSIKEGDSLNCPLIVNNNHVNKNKKSKLRLSSLETNDKSNKNKRFKSDNFQRDTINPLEVTNEQNLELTTPTFNLTSTSKSTSRRTSRKLTVDINNPIYKIPFDHGWKRELVYRTTGDFIANNRSNRNGDVYYYSPNNRKLRSLREIQELLNLSLNDNFLTIDSFTFLKQPIGINDRSKEIIRDANTKLSKEDSFTGVTIKSKKAKTPVRPALDYASSDNENNKSSNKVKVVFKNDTKRSKSTIKKIKTNLPEASSSIPEYITEDWEAIQSGLASTISPPKVDDSVKNTKVDDSVKNTKVDDSVKNTTVDKIEKRRLSTSDGEVIMQAPCGIRCLNNDEPATLMCAQCLVYYHPACVNLSANLKIVGYVCINCRSSVRQRNRRVQSSHTVVVGASEPEQLRVEPIRIRQVNQTADASNFFIDKTPTSQNEEEPCENDEHIDENNSDMNTVVCQGNVYKTAMIDNNFHEQYVYEMKRTRGASLMTCVIQEPIHLEENAEVNGSLKEATNSMIYMQSFNYMVKAMRLVFKQLKICDLLSASRVCTAWNIIAMNKSLWQHVYLKNSRVYDWGKCIDTINNQGTVLLDTKRMLMSDKTDEFERFWLLFCKDIKRANKITNIELYRCPTHAIEDILYSLPQLNILRATSIKNPLISNDGKNANDYMTLNLKYLGQMKNLTELNLKGLSGIKLIKLTSFKNLKNLNCLSLTSIKSFPKDTCSMLETITPNLEHLEIGDCDSLTREFPISLRKFTNLKSLRLENCCGNFGSFAQEVFVAIRSFKKLVVLELINIEFKDYVEEELIKCVGVRALLIIPAYISQSATTNCHLIDCLKKLSNTLTHLVWGITHELLRVTDLFISQYQQNQHEIGYSLDLTHTPTSTNNIPVLRTRKPKKQPGEERVLENKKNKSENVDILSVPALEKLLRSILKKTAKMKIVKVPFSKTTRVYLNEHFDNIY